jgi:amidase
MARSGADLVLLLSVITGEPTPAQIAPTDPRSLRVGLWLDDPAMVLDPIVRSAIEAWSAEVAADGVAIEPMVSPLHAETLLSTYNFLLMAHLAGGFPDKAWSRWAEKRDLAQAKMRKGAGPLSYPATILAATASHREWMRHDEIRHQLMGTIAKAFERYDVIVTPVAPVEPFVHDHSDFHRRQLTCSTGGKIDYAAMKTWVALATTCGLPATAIPAGHSPHGLPIGVQVIGPFGRDAQTLAAAMTLERAGGGYRAPPDVL